MEIYILFVKNVRKMSEKKEFDLEKEEAFICKVCGDPVPNNNYWRVWSVFIGEICKKCQLKNIGGKNKIKTYEIKGDKIQKVK